MNAQPRFFSAIARVSAIARLSAIARVSAIAAAAAASAAPLDRPRDPVVLTGAALPSLAGLPPAQVVAFRFSGGWQQIPVQIDERKTVDYGAVYNSGNWGRTTGAYADAGTFAGADANPAFDSDDELAFMARDAGAAAPSSGSLPPGVVAATGVELEITDPLGGGPAYVYLFRSDGSLAPGAGADYVTYNFVLLAGAYLSTYNTNSGPNPENSTVQTAYYGVHFSDRWIQDVITIAAGGATGADILDRHKTLYSPGVCTRSENTFSNGEGAFFTNKDGPVRAIRSYMGANSGPLTQREHVYYQQREDMTTWLRVHSIGSIMDFVDYSPAASGMTYYNNLNPVGVLIDGNPDSVNPGPLTWQMAAGPQGSLVQSGRLNTNIANLSVTSYYSDDSTPSTTQCTGDAFEYGASGMYVNATIPNTDPLLGATSTLSVRAVLYYEPPSQPAALAILRDQQAATPLAVVSRPYNPTPPCPGDADGDGDVDQDDLDLVLFNFGTSQPPGTGGDVDGDGDVDQDDLDEVLFNFGTPPC